MVTRAREARPAASWRLREETDHKLDALDRRILTEGPQNAGEEVAREAGLIIRTTDPTEREQIARAYGLLCDAGAEPGQESALRGYAGEAVVRYHAIAKERKWESGSCARLAAALLRFSNACRSCKDNRAAEDTAADAYRILTEKCDPQHLYVTPILNEANVRAVRLLGDGRGDKRRLEKQRDELMERARDINTPADMRRSAARELAGYWEMSWEISDSPGGRDLAMEQLAIITALQEEMPDRSDYDEPTFLRPRIEFYLASDRKTDNEEAIRLIMEDYIGCYYPRNRHSYYAERICRWSRHRVAGPAIRDVAIRLLRDLPPTYNSPLLISLPRGY